ncbi:hypothetical protein GCM10027160_32500 [Streptomyces calidiresistens]|uniref:winged helix-turn-helix domain-containing protein n=1 Tax=Streptomyces calidiresistens TaxID=1485586 RepID=UPI0015FB0A5E
MGAFAEYLRRPGLRSEADDCPGKPHGLRIAHGPPEIDPARREVGLEGRPVRTTREEFDLLHHLARQPETVASRRQLMSEIRGAPSGRRSEAARSTPT